MNISHYIEIDSNKAILVVISHEKEKHKVILCSSKDNIIYGDNQEITCISIRGWCTSYNKWFGSMRELRVIY